MTSIEELQERYMAFIEERDWRQFHSPKNDAMAIAVEAAELLEIFQWQDDVDAAAIRESDETLDAVEEELADVMIYCLTLSALLDIDITAAIEDTIDENEKRFDPDKAAKMNQHMNEFPH